jgi:hypothetical protein
MPLNLASPGIVVREIDLTNGRVDPATGKAGAIVAPFTQGPVNSPTIINSEQELLNIFGKPHPIDKQYESWFVASSYLAYGGSLRVVRSGGQSLRNAFAGAASSITINSIEDYENKGYDESTIQNVIVAAKNPGSWANGLRVALIDSKADQILSGITTTAVSSFTSVVSTSGTVGVTTNIITGITTTSISVGLNIVEINGVIDSQTTVSEILGTESIRISKLTLNTGTITGQNFTFGQIQLVSAPIQVGYGITQAIDKILPGVGSTSRLDGYLKGLVTEVGNSSIAVKVVGHVASDGTETDVEYQSGGVYNFNSSGVLGIHTNSVSTSYGTASYTSQLDWFDQQEIQITNSGVSTVTIPWNSVASRPGTTSFATNRACKNDEIHILVIDGDGSYTGNVGQILEKHIGLSKASDAQFSSGSPSYWRKYLKTGSANIFGGSQPAGIVTTGFSSGFNLQIDNAWDQPAEGVIFSATGNNLLTLSGGTNYDGNNNIENSGALSASFGDVSQGYALFENTEQFNVDFLIMGSASYAKEEAQSLANKLIAVSEIRKDCISFISPYRGAFLQENGVGDVTFFSSDVITDNILSFYASITSSSYAVFDSGYKYMYDRFANTFRYIPLNGDIAGTCARNDLNNFPWFSPAGTSRGTILNAVKLAYNPSKSQRDRLYTNRINPVIFSPGSGIILFGDKTALSRSSAFDRINVRRLFVYLENAISSAARDQLFEFNDEITRTNFVNIIEPFLRDVQAKRGIFDYIVVCDETNNTASVIDNNEFVADIYIKPTRSINFIGLTFVATRTGVAFEEIIGSV